MSQTLDMQRRLFLILASLGSTNEHWTEIHPDAERTEGSAYSLQTTTEVINIIRPTLAWTDRGSTLYLWPINSSTIPPGHV